MFHVEHIAFKKMSNERKALEDLAKEKKYDFGRIYKIHDNKRI